MKEKNKIISESHIELFNLIEERTGLYFPDKKKNSLIQTISKHYTEKGFSSYKEYLYHINKEEKLFQELINQLTIRESYFFRNKSQFQMLEELILPKLLQSPQKYQINIWCAGCACGEEPYSLAILIQRLSSLAPKKKIFLIATDINTDFLKKAVEGVYTKRAIRDVPEKWLNIYFSYRDSLYYLKDDIKKLVKFELLNLVEDHYPLEKELDLIICRNVLIYFHLPTAFKIVDRFYHHLSSGGWLMLGEAEAPILIGKQFNRINYKGSFIYQKPHSTTSSVIITRTAELPLLPKSKETTTSPLSTREEKEKKPWDTYLKLKKLVQKEKASNILPVLQNFLNENPLFSLGYYLLALIQKETGNLEEAEKTLKKLIFLNHSFPLAHYLLGNIQEVKQSLSKAKIYYNNALRLLINYSEEKFIEETDGISKQEFIKFLKEKLKEE